MVSKAGTTNSRDATGITLDVMRPVAGVPSDSGSVKMNLPNSTPQEVREPFLEFSIRFSPSMTSDGLEAATDRDGAVAGTLV